MMSTLNIRILYIEHHFVNRWRAIVMNLEICEGGFEANDRRGCVVGVVWYRHRHCRLRHHRICFPFDYHRLLLRRLRRRYRHRHQHCHLHRIVIIIIIVIVIVIVIVVVVVVIVIVIVIVIVTIVVVVIVIVIIVVVVFVIVVIVIVIVIVIVVVVVVVVIVIVIVIVIIIIIISSSSSNSSSGIIILPSKVVPVYDRMDYLHVPLERDHTQVGDGRVEQHVDQSFADEHDAHLVSPDLHLRRVHGLLQDQSIGNHESQTGQEIQENLIIDEEV